MHGGLLGKDQMFEEMQLVPRVKDCKRTCVQGREEVGGDLVPLCTLVCVIPWKDFHPNGCLKK